MTHPELFLLAALVFGIASLLNPAGAIGAVRIFGPAAVIHALLAVTARWPYVGLPLAAILAAAPLIKWYAKIFLAGYLGAEGIKASGLLRRQSKRRKPRKDRFRRPEKNMIRVTKADTLMTRSRFDKEQMK